jgi:hypothetical protein
MHVFLSHEHCVNRLPDLTSSTAGENKRLANKDDLKQTIGLVLQGLVRVRAEAEA